MFKIIGVNWTCLRLQCKRGCYHQCLQSFSVHPENIISCLTSIAPHPLWRYCSITVFFTVSTIRGRFTIIPRDPIKVQIRCWHKIIEQNSLKLLLATRDWMAFDVSTRRNRKGNLKVSMLSFWGEPRFQHQQREKHSLSWSKTWCYFLTFTRIKFGTSILYEKGNLLDTVGDYFQA